MKGIKKGFLEVLGEELRQEIAWCVYRIKSRTVWLEHSK